MRQKPPIDDEFSEFQSDDKTKISPIQKLDPLEIQRKPSLLMISGVQIGRNFLMEDEFLIGRAPQCDLPIEDDLVSRHHCKITWINDTAELIDLASTNGTLLNGRKVERSFLQEGDQIQVGATTILKFQLQEDIEAKFMSQLYEAATRDFLTGAYNKKFFIERLRDEFAFSQRHQQDLSILVIDIDHFKKVNDSYGHLAGDIALKKVAHHILSHTRKDDIVARFGGEEFVVLMRDINLKKAQHLGEALRSGIQDISIKGDNSEFSVTVSIGVATLSEKSRPQFKSFDQFIEHADKRLYEAKNSGRNRVCS